MIKLILHQGLGDNIYARPYVREYVRRGDVALETPFPQLFDGLGVKEFVLPQTRLLDTQKENVSKYPLSFWTRRTKWAHTIRLVHTGGLKQDISICHAMDSFIKPDSFDFSLTPNPIWKNTAKSIISLLDIKKPICLVKFPTERRDFNIPSRNPKMEYFTKFIEENKSYHYIDITRVSDSEWYAQEPPKLMRLEIDINTLIGLASIADMNLFSPSFMLPLTIALGATAFCIFGGYMKPSLLTDSRMNLTKFHYVAPENFCNCKDATHACFKEIDERYFSRLQAA